MVITRNHDNQQNNQEENSSAILAEVRRELEKKVHLIPFAKKTKGYDKGSRGWRKSNITKKFTRREKALGKRVEKNNPGRTTEKSNHIQTAAEKNPDMSVGEQFPAGKSKMRHHVLSTTHVGSFLLLMKYWQPSCLLTGTTLHWTSMTTQQIWTSISMRMSLN